MGADAGAFGRNPNHHYECVSPLSTCLKYVFRDKLSGCRNDSIKSTN